MGHLLHIALGGKPGESVADPSGDTAQQVTNLALFVNVESDAFFGHGLSWSATDYEPDPPAAWMFSMRDGEQTALSQDFQLLAWPCDPATPSSPCPSRQARQWWRGRAMLALPRRRAAVRRASTGR